MKRAAKRKKKKSRVLPVVLLSLAVGSLATLAAVYSPAWIKTEAEQVVELFQINDSTPPPDTIYIQVRNGVGVDDLAAKAQNFLETRTGDVVFYAPGPPADAARRDYELTVIMSHVRSFAAAEKVADVMELGDSSVVMLLPETGIYSDIDVTIILGRDRDDPSFYIPYRD